MNHLSDPSFETGSGWSLINDLCAIGGASYNTALGNVRTGARSLRINSKFSAITPTCGGITQTVSGIVVGKSYVCGVWWKASGVTSGVVAHVNFSGVDLFDITGNTIVWKMAAGVVVATSTTPSFDLIQEAGQSTLLQSRYFDDAFVLDAESPEAAALLSLSVEGGINSTPALVTGAAVSSGRVVAGVSSLALSCAPSSLSLRAIARKP